MKNFQTVDEKIGTIVTVGKLLEKGNEILKDNEIDTYILDTQLLLGYVLNKDRIWLITNRSKKVKIEDETKFYELLLKRKYKMPIKYILQECEFMGLNFYVKQGVLIPRGDTEVLVEEVLSRIGKDDDLAICDLCCGSGAIGLSLAYYRKNIKVDLIDIDDIPKQVTNINIKKLDLEQNTNFIQSDLLNEVIEKNEKYDILVSNPPYIREDVIPTLMEDVKNYEPKLALVGGEDGLDFYKKIVNQSLKVLKNNGILAFEIGHDQGEDVKNLMFKSNFRNLQIIKDLAGLDRVVIGNLIEKN